jgi:hypothetical protein
MWSANRRLAADWRGTSYTDALNGRRIEALAGKPILLAETAAGARSPAHPDWRLEATPAALPAFKADAAS